MTHHPFSPLCSTRSFFSKTRRLHLASKTVIKCTVICVFLQCFRRRWKLSPKSFSNLSAIKLVQYERISVDYTRSLLTVNTVLPSRLIVMDIKSPFFSRKQHGASFRPYANLHPVLCFYSTWTKPLPKPRVARVLVRTNSRSHKP